MPARDPQVVNLQDYNKEFKKYNEEFMQVTTLLDALEAVVPEENEKDSVDLQTFFTQHQEGTPKGKNTMLIRSLDSAASIIVTHKEVVSVQVQRLSSKPNTDEHIEVESQGKTEKKTRSQDQRGVIARLLICKSPHEETEKKKE